MILRDFDHGLEGNFKLLTLPDQPEVFTGEGHQNIKFNDFAFCMRQFILLVYEPKKLSSREHAMPFLLQPFLQDELKCP